METSGYMRYGGAVLPWIGLGSAHSAAPRPSLQMPSCRGGLDGVISRLTARHLLARGVSVDVDVEARVRVVFNQVRSVSSRGKCTVSSPALTIDSEADIYIPTRWFAANRVGHDRYRVDFDYSVCKCDGSASSDRRRLTSPQSSFRTVKLLDAH